MPHRSLDSALAVAERQKKAALVAEKEAVELGSRLRLSIREASRCGDAQAANEIAREMAFLALLRDAQGALHGPILQQLWGHALSGQGGAAAALAIFVEGHPWRGPGRLGRPEILACGVASALQRKPSEATLEAGLLALSEAGAPLAAAMAWCERQRGETPQIMGVEEGFRAMEAFALRQAQREAALGRPEQAEPVQEKTGGASRPPSRL